MEAETTISRAWLTWTIHIMLAAIAASILSVVSAYLWGWVSMLYFAHEYPYDGQDGLGALAVGLMAGLASWVLCFWVGISILQERSKRRRTLKLLHSPVHEYSITGREV